MSARPIYWTGEFTGVWNYQNGAESWTYLGYNYQTFAGFGDFAGNGSSDPLFVNASTGDVSYWTDSVEYQPPSVYLGAAGTGYAIAGVADLLRVGSAQILWLNAYTRDAGVWKLTDGADPQWSDLGLAPSGLDAAKFGDFYADGSNDILWYNPTGVSLPSAAPDTEIWRVDSTGLVTAATHLATGGVGYDVVGVGDFTGSGVSDVLFEDESWQTAASNVGYWLVSDVEGAPQVTNWVSLGWGGAGYHIAGVGDYTGSGKAEILWNNSATGDTGVWIVGAGGTGVTWQELGVAGQPYTISG